MGETTTAVFQMGRSSSIYSLDAHRKIPTSWSRAIVGWYHSQWMQRLQVRFDELTALPRGWNGYRSLPVSFSCASFAANLLERICVDNLPPPSLVPGTDGSLQIEWHRNGFDVEIDVLGPNSVVATRYDVHCDVEEVVELRNDFSILALWAQDLVEPRGQLEAAAS